MTRSIRKTFAFCAIAAIGMCRALPVTAESGTQPSADCAQKFENGQRLRKEGKLKAATEALIACSQPSCPQFIAKECTNLYTEAQSSLPSITLRASDGKGQLLAEVEVYLDGQLITKSLDGRAVAVDPGVHEVRFELNGKPPLTQKVLVAEGEKNKVVSAEFPSPQSAPEAGSPGQTKTVTPPPTAPAESSTQPEQKHRTPVAAIVVGSLGIVAIGTGVALQLSASKQYKDLEKSCKPNCTDEQTAPVDRKYNWSYVSFAVGGAALVTAGVLYFVSGGSSKSNQTAGLTLEPVGFGSGALASWRGGF